MKCIVGLHGWQVSPKMGDHRGFIACEWQIRSTLAKLGPNGSRISRRRRRAAQDALKVQRSCAPKAVGWMRVLGAGRIHITSSASQKTQLLHEQPGLIGAVERIRQQWQPLHVEFFFGQAKGLYSPWTVVGGTPQGPNGWKNGTPPDSNPSDIPQTYTIGIS